MKKLFIIICALFVGFAYGANENVPTSKKFVDDALAQKQPKFDGLGNDKLMLYSNTTDGVVASRDIVTTLGNSTSDTSVPTVGAINTGLNTKQDMLNGDAGWVAENTGIAGAVVQKPVYSATNNYSNALVEVETLNNAVINAVNSELTVVPGVGWTINTANNLNLLSVPKTYNPYLPDGYTQVEYLASSGGQWIDTGITANASIIVDMGVMSTSYGNVQVAIGTRNGTNTSDDNVFQFGFYNLNDAPKTFFNRYGLGYIKGDSYSTDTWYTVHLENNNCTIQSDNESFSNAYTFRPTMNTAGTLYLFATNDTSQGAVFRLTGRISYCRIQKNGALVRNFIPARRNSDNALGMYDTVSGTFFTNRGTGTFTAGPVVNY